MEMMIPEFKEIKNELSDVKELISFALTGSPAKLTITVKEIAEKEGCSVSALSPSGKERYLLPRFGESGYPDGPKRWDLIEYWKWRQIPVEERKAMYKEHLRNVREANIASRNAKK